MMAGSYMIRACVRSCGLIPPGRSGQLKVIDLDGPGIAGGLRAAICDMPYMPVPDLGTDLSRHAPDYYRELPSLPSERKMLAVAPIRPDVCLLHAQQADEAGNVQYLGSPIFDAMLAQASRKVIVSVDRIVSSATGRASNHLTKLPSALVDVVVHAPFGAHPTASPSLYRNDEDHLREYLGRAAATRNSWPIWIPMSAPSGRKRI
jgi:glutaconate CoA-transferase subunit A